MHVLTKSGFRVTKSDKRPFSARSRRFLCCSLPLHYWTPLNFLESTFIEGYSCFISTCSDSAASFLQQLSLFLIWQLLLFDDSV